MKRIFISSTFIDMQNERDLFHTAIVPAINRVAKQYGDEVSVCDLRWGVNTKELDSAESEKKVLSVCLDEIDRCDATEGSPYFIVILGNRYGWAPDSSLIQSVAARKNFTALNKAQSVTELEIAYGALRDRGHLDRTLFYFRDFTCELPKDSRYAVDGKDDSEREENRAKLDQLKSLISEAAGERVKNYSVSLEKNGKTHEETLVGLDGFVSMVTKDVLSMMAKEWENYTALSPHEKLVKSQWNMARQKASQFGARKEEAARILESVRKGQAITVLRGKSGSGKSTLMSHTALALREEGVDVIPIYCGSAANLNDAMDLLCYIVYELEERLQLPHRSDTESENQNGDTDLVDGWRERLQELVALCGEKKLVILIDAVDQLFDDELRERCVFLPTESAKGVSFVVSCLEYHVLTLPITQEISEICLRDMTRAETLTAVRSILRYLGRELEERVIKAIAKKPEAANPLYLSLLIQRLVMMDRHSFDEIAGLGDDDKARERYKLGMISRMANTVEDACYEIMAEACKRIGGDYLLSAMHYIALSQNGLRESDLSDILTRRGIVWSSLDFSLLINYWPSFFIIRDDGRIDFTHKTIRAGLQKHCADPKAMHIDLRKHLQTLDLDDVLSLDETVYQSVYADDKKYFVSYIESLAKESYETGLPQAAKALYDSINQGGTEWIFSIIRNARELKLGRSFFRFLFFYLSPYFCYTSAKYRVLISILQESAIQYAACLEDGDDSDRVLLAEMHKTIGICFDTLMQYTLAEEHYQQTIRLLAPMPDSGDVMSNLAEVYNRYGLMLMQGKRYQEAFSNLRLAADLWEKQGDGISLAVVYHNMAEYFDLRYEYTEALNYEKKALSLLKESEWEPHHVGNMVLYHRRIALDYYHLQRAEEGVVYAERALTLANRYAALKPQEYEAMLGYTLNDYAVVCANDRYSPAMVECFQKATTILEKYAKILPEEHENTLATVLQNLAWQYAQNQETYAQAEVAYERSILILEKLYIEHPEAMAIVLALAYNNLGLLCMKRRKRGEAKRFFLLAIRVAHKSRPEEIFLNKDNIVRFYRNAARAYRSLLSPFQATEYDVCAEKLERCQTQEALIRTFGSDRNLKSLFGKRKENASHLFVKLSNVVAYLQLYLIFYACLFAIITGIESVLNQWMLLSIAGGILFVTGFLAAIAVSRELALTVKQRVFLWAGWLLSVGLVTGVYVFYLRKCAKKQRRCGIHLQIKSKEKIKATKAKDKSLIKKIARLEKTNQYLEKQFILLRDDLYCVKRLRWVFFGMTSGIGLMLLHILNLRLFYLYAAFALCNVITSIFVVRHVRGLNRAKVALLATVAVASCGMLTGLVSFLLFYRDFHIKQTRMLSIALVALGSMLYPLLYQTQVMLAWCWLVYLVVWISYLRPKKNVKIVRYTSEYPVEKKLRRNTEKLHSYRAKLMHWKNQS